MRNKFIKNKKWIKYVSAVSLIHVNWAFSTPLRKTYYNLSVTGMSVIAALFIGLIELIQVITPKLGLKDGLWRWIQNLNFGSMGYLLVILFILTWGFSYLGWKLLHLDKL